MIEEAREVVLRPDAELRLIRAAAWNSTQTATPTPNGHFKLTNRTENNPTFIFGTAYLTNKNYLFC